jgi:hypothetical protein
MPTPSVFKSAFLQSAAASLFVVKKDGKTLTEPMSNNECFKWLHDRVSSSVDWAIKYEGYSIDPAKPGDGPDIPDLSSPEDQAFMKEMAISGSLKRRPDYRVTEPADPLTKEAAAVSASPREYPVAKKQDGFWYIVGLEGQELSEESEGPPVISTPDSWLNVHQHAKNLDLAEQLYRELYAEFQTNDNLKEGDIFATPIGKFVCQGVDVVPYDDAAKRAISEVDESYRCDRCGCDQGKHKKSYDDNGYKVYGQCSDHPDCPEYVRSGV